MPDSDVIQYGPDLPTEAGLRLLGDLHRKRVLELGCGPYASAVGFAKAGATTIVVDNSPEALAAMREACEREEVRVELREGDLAQLAFLRAETIDVAFSAYGLEQVANLGRLLRQVHRVLRPGGILVFSLTHPAYNLADRSYWDGEHTFSELYQELVRAGFRVEQLLEPQPRVGGGLVPRTLIVKARKD